MRAGPRAPPQPGAPRPQCGVSALEAGTQTVLGRQRTPRRRGGQRVRSGESLRPDDRSACGSDLRAIAGFRLVTIFVAKRLTDATLTQAGSN